MPYISSSVQVDVLVTTAGGIEEDLIKCLGPVFVGDFNMSGKDLYKKGLNRLGRRRWNLMTLNFFRLQFDLKLNLPWVALFLQERKHSDV